MNIYIIGGTFDDDGGKPSGFINRLAENIYDAKVYNGGSWKELLSIYEDLEHADAVLWFANVPNDKPKIVESIKKDYPRLLLVTSKRNDDDKYAFSELVARALKLKSNLFVEFIWSGDRVYSSVFDPLGNCYKDRMRDPFALASCITIRLEKLKNMTRIGSICIGPRIEAPSTPEINEFIRLTKAHAAKFHDIIHGVNTDRMLGNSSFRCQRGFPSFRKGGLLFVSRRNIDKRDIDLNGFVGVYPKITCEKVQYYGQVKPSVDTPIQVMLYDHYRNVNFMLHSHTYVKGASMTENKVPCGAIEEVYEVMSVMSDRDSTDFFINLRGHGSIVFGSNARFFKKVPWIARPVPEF